MSMMQHDFLHLTPAVALKNAVRIGLTTSVTVFVDRTLPTVPSLPLGTELVVVHWQQPAFDRHTFI